LFSCFAFASVYWHIAKGQTPQAANFQDIKNQPLLLGSQAPHYALQAIPVSTAATVRYSTARTLFLPAGTQLCSHEAFIFETKF
jgi:hypothetical protein